MRPETRSYSPRDGGSRASIGGFNERLNFSAAIKRSGIKNRVRSVLFSKRILSKLTLEKTSHPPPELVAITETMRAQGYPPPDTKEHYTSLIRGDYIFTLNEVVSGIFQFQTARLDNPMLIDLITVTDDLVEIDTSLMDPDNPQNSRLIRQSYNDEQTLLEIERWVEVFASPNPVQVPVFTNIVSI